MAMGFLDKEQSGPLGCFALLGFILAWPPAEQLRPFRTRSIRRLDIPGCILLIAASVLSTFAFQEAGLDTRNWGSALFLASLLVGIVCWVALFAWEVAVARYWSATIDAVIPLHLLQHRVFAFGVVVTTLTGFTYFVVVYSIPFRFEVMNLKSPLGAGVGILPLVGASAVGSMVTGFWNAKKDMTFYGRFVGSCLVLIGAGLLCTLTNTLRVQVGIYGYQVFIGLGFGLIVAATSIMAKYEVEPRDLATAQGIIAQFRILGGSLGVAASSAIRGAVDLRELGGPVPPQTMTSLTPANTAIRQSYTDSFNESMMEASEDNSGGKGEGAARGRDFIRKTMSKLSDG
ncbi:MAG: hypothetical protein M1821_001788 [Bathelium mastoideum]|nr:MAG: hypothetical protein M1821_001788 [Bathelium mastoideum]